MIPVLLACSALSPESGDAGEDSETDSAPAAPDSVDSAPPTDSVADSSTDSAVDTSADACPPGQALDIDGQSCSECLPREARDLLDETWSYREPELLAYMATAAIGNYGALYDSQLFVAPLFETARSCGEIAWLDDLAGLVLAAQAGMADYNGRRTWITSEAEGSTEVGELYLFQWMWLASGVVHAAVELPEADRTPNLQAVLAHGAELGPIYRAWAFEEANLDYHGWACDGGLPLQPSDTVTVAATVTTTDPDGIVYIDSGVQQILYVSGGKLAGDVMTWEPDATLGRDYSRWTVTGATPINDGTPHRVAMVADATAGTFQLYVDGAEDGSLAITEAMVQGWPGWGHIGGYNYDYGSCCFLEATIADVTVNHAAHTAAETLGVVTDELVAHWTLTADGADATGDHDLVEGSGASFGADGATFDGVDDYARTHLYYLGQSYEWAMRGKATGNIPDEDDDPGYCSAVHDVDLWFVSGLAELLAARAAGAGESGLSDDDAAQLTVFVQDAVQLIEQRTSLSTLPSGDIGAVFEADGYVDHEEFAWSGYEGADFPSEDTKAAATHPGWDISHARRLPNALGSLYRARDTLGADWPDDAVMAAFAAQYVQVQYNGDAVNPRFTNFVGGADGWYRWEYSGRVGFGYQPGDLSNAGFEGGYGQWRRWDESVDDVTRAAWPVYTNAARAADYGVYWMEYAREGGVDVDPATSWNLLMYLPSLAAGDE